MTAKSRTPIALWLLVGALLLDAGLLLYSRKLDRAAVALVHVGIFSIAAFVAFAWDKLRARSDATRVRESTLLALAVLGGALGALAAMLIARHKTRRALFWIVVLGALFAHVTLVGWLFISR